MSCTIPSFEEIVNEASGIYDDLLKMRRTLHQYPETFFKEFKTSEFIQQFLTEMEVPFTAGWGVNTNDPHQKIGTGVIAQLGTGHSPCIALRADIDGLHLPEYTDLPFKSKHEGYMHACGHDVHTAMLLGAAKVLKAYEQEIEGTVKFLFQPGEEGGGGAAMMVNEGALSDYPPIQHVFGLHVSGETPTNSTLGGSGTLGAGMDDYIITLKGKGGHGAMPHLAIDPIPAGVAIARSLNDIYARELFFQTDTAGLISTTFFKTTSKASNIIPDEVKLGGTFRAFSVQKMDQIRDRIHQVAHDIAHSYRCEVTVGRQQNVAFPPMHVDPALYSDYLENIHPSEVPIISMSTKVMGGEDFAFYAHKVPSMMIVIGTGSGHEIEGHPPTNISAHNTYFAVDERAMPTGVGLHVNFALKKLHQLANEGFSVQSQDEL